MAFLGLRCFNAPLFFILLIEHMYVFIFMHITV
nr:MAG TPA: hypothetical protein [Caudoviricetes sp.]